MDPVPECHYPECFLCIAKERKETKLSTIFARFFRDLPSHDEEGQILVISRLWNTAMAHPNEAEFVQLGILECMTAMIWKGLKNRAWLAEKENIYIPYYAAHIIGSYTMNVEEFAQRAVQAGAIAPLLELLKGKLTWVEQRVAVRALGHIASYDTTFVHVSQKKEVLKFAMQLANTGLDIVYTSFIQPVGKRLGYHCDLLTRGMGGLEIEARKAEEWASQLLCWSLQLINCFALREEFLTEICKAEFVSKLPEMWGGLVNESSPAGVGLLRTICYHKLGRIAIANSSSVVAALCHIARSSDDWQYMAVDCLLWLLQDPITREKVFDRAALALADLIELPSLADQKKPGEVIIEALLQPQSPGQAMSSETQEILNYIFHLKQRTKKEKHLTKDDIKIKQAASLVLKLEGNSRFSAGDIHGAIAKYTRAMEVCPIRAKKDRITIYNNRAQCYLVIEEPERAVSDTTRALCLHSPVNRHSSSLWRRAQAYDMMGLAKESLLDAIMYVNESFEQHQGQEGVGSNSEFKKGVVPHYVQRLVKRQMQKTWLFKQAAEKHGYEQQLREGEEEEGENEDEEESEWETASSENESEGQDESGSSESDRVERVINRSRTNAFPANLVQRRAKSSAGRTLKDFRC